MKKLLFACILSIGVFQSQAQVFLCEPEVLKGVESLPKYHEIVALLNKDVIHYYDLSSEYSSDLQKKVFQSSDEYKYLHASLSVAYDKAMGQSFTGHGLCRLFRMIWRRNVWSAVVLG